MSLIFADGFDKYNNAVAGLAFDSPNSPWTNGSVSFVARRGGYALRLDTDNYSHTHTFQTSSGSATLGVAVKGYLREATGGTVISLSGSGVSVIASVVENAGKYMLRTSAGNVATTYVVNRDVFIYYEIQVTPTRAALRINGVELASITGSFVSPTSIDINGNGRQFDDLYLRDDDLWMGPIYIDDLLNPVPAVTNSVIAVGASSVLAAVATPDGDASYAHSTADGSTFLFSGTAPPDTFGIIQHFAARNSEMSNYAAEQLSGPIGDLRSEGTYPLYQDQYRKWQVTRDKWEDEMPISTGGFAGRVFGYRTFQP